MKNNISISMLVVVLVVLSLLLSGCQFWAQPGKTAKEGTRDQVRMLKVNHRELMQDLNHAMFLDRPSKLNEMSIP
jgi:hypothetical protein